MCKTIWKIIKIVGNEMEKRGTHNGLFLVCSLLGENSSCRVHLGGEGPNHIEQLINLEVRCIILIE
jgi:hypothetical protein